MDKLLLIGYLLRSHRVKKGLTARELSNISGVSLPSIARFESGKGNISLSNLVQIMESLDLMLPFTRLLGEGLVEVEERDVDQLIKGRARVRKKSEYIFEYDKKLWEED